jgi:hypothetical protein
MACGFCGDLRYVADSPCGFSAIVRLVSDCADGWGVTCGLADGAPSQFAISSVQPMHRRYVVPQKRWADILLNGTCRRSDLTRIRKALSKVIDRH